FVNFSDPDEGEFQTGRVQASPARDRFTLPTLDAELDLGDIKLISNTSYFTRNAVNAIDYTNFIASVLLGGPLNYNQGETSTATIRDKQRNFTQELRLQTDTTGPLNLTLGAFYSHARQESDQYNEDPFI